MKMGSQNKALPLTSQMRIPSDIPIVADIRLAIVGNAMMLLIDYGFHNRKSS
jgi:hypothetical protein